MAIRRRQATQPRRQHETKVIVLYSRGLKEKRARLQIEVQALHASKEGKTIEECKLIDDVINGKVISFNLHDLKTRRRFDLHWMTIDGAIQFVQTIVEGINDTEPIHLITGRGFHSKNNVPKIKSALTTMYSDRRDFEIREEAGNSGILLLTKLAF